MGPPRVLAIMGSGETAPSMVSTHRSLLGRAGDGSDPDARLLDTPYGFQENADEITARACRYFAHNVGREVRPLGLRRPLDLSMARREEALLEAADADWLFAGPGSPSYLLRQWRGPGMRQVLVDALHDGGVLVFASAAACALGSHAAPVYEIYKIGADPFWLEGLDLMREAGLDAVVIPHFDNAEGGTHDTRRCYLGERRLRRMEARLPTGTWVLGVDEHTAAVLDLDAGTLTVRGRGGVTVRGHGTSHTHPADVTVPLRSLPPTGATPPPAAAPDPSDSRGRTREEPRGPAELLEAFEHALRAGRITAAVDTALELQARLGPPEGAEPDAAGPEHRMLRRMIVRLGRLARAGQHDHRDLVAPHVRALLRLRERARGQRDWTTADRIREDLVAAGVEVHDTPEGPRWEYDEPLHDDPPEGTTGS